MRLNANSLGTNVMVTALVLLMVFVMPWVDRRVCRRLGLNLQGGISSNPKANALMRLRQGLLYGILGLYLTAVAWIVFFSRTASEEYVVHVALFEDLTNAVEIDFGFLHAVRIFFTEGPAAALSHIEVVKPEDIAQVYMNMMLFVPMGYLLPYCSRWFRNRVRIRPVLACFLMAFAIENLQLIFRVGFYDMDDLVSNTIGGLAGQTLFISVAYVVTHPGWRSEMRDFRTWQRHAWRRTLYPYSRRIGTLRTSLTAAREEAAWDFYVTKLGFRPVKQLRHGDGKGTDLLLEMGRMQVEIHCLNREAELQPQTLNLTVSRLEPVMRRLRRSGIEPGRPEQDVYTGLRCVRFDGPDGVRVQVTEG